MDALDDRLRGRRGVEQRQGRLAAEPRCRHCRERGRLTPATVPDHIIPLAFGGTDDDDNIQCLCDPCHLIKTAAEGAQSSGASNHPEWLQPSAIPLTIVCGPPCSGKTTFVQTHAHQHDRVICLDTILAGIKPGYLHWSGMLDRELLNKAVRIRNAELGRLARASSGRAWFIVAAPSYSERDWWAAQLGGEVLLLNPGAAECKRRALTRDTPAAAQGVDAWETASRLPWSAPKPKVQKAAIGADGWPE